MITRKGLSGLGVSKCDQPVRPILWESLVTTPWNRELQILQSTVWSRLFMSAIRYYFADTRREARTKPNASSYC